MEKIKPTSVLENSTVFFGKHTLDFWETFTPFSPSYSAFKMRRTCTKKQGQVPVSQILAFYVADFQHLTILPLQLAARLLGDADYQLFT